MFHLFVVMICYLLLFFHSAIHIVVVCSVSQGAGLEGCSDRWVYPLFSRSHYKFHSVAYPDSSKLTEIFLDRDKMFRYEVPSVHD